MLILQTQDFIVLKIIKIIICFFVLPVNKEQGNRKSKRTVIYFNQTYPSEICSRAELKTPSLLDHASDSPNTSLIFLCFRLSPGIYSWEMVVGRLA